MATCLLSLALNKSVPPNLAMTGELTLTGRVLGIGELESKIEGARQQSIDVIIVPEDNFADLKLQNLDGIHFVSKFQDIFDIVFKD